MIIAFDLDDVLGQFSEALADWWNRTYGTEFRVEEFCHTDFAKMWCVTAEELAARLKLFDETEAKELMLPHRGSQEVVRRLRVEKLYELHVVTNRPVEISLSSWHWVQKHFPGLITDIHFCTKDWGLTRVKTKGEVCKSIGARIIFEDHPHNANDCAQNGVEVYLFNRPWNQDQSGQNSNNIRRVSCWEDPIIKALYQK